MLVRTRKLGEKIVISNNITMPVVSISNGVVWLSIAVSKKVWYCAKS